MVPFVGGRYVDIVASSREREVTEIAPNSKSIDLLLFMYQSLMNLISRDSPANSR